MYKFGIFFGLADEGHARAVCAPVQSKNACVNSGHRVRAASERFKDMLDLLTGAGARANELRAVKGSDIITKVIDQVPMTFVAGQRHRERTAGGAGVEPSINP